MSQVYFLKDFSRLETFSLPILKNYFTQEGEILIKLHFGEPGNKTALIPGDLLPIVVNLKKINLTPTFIDTPVAYDSPRNTVNGYIQVIKDRGWFNLGKCQVSDKYLEIDAKDFKVRICRELTEAQNLLVISHVKGHPCSGFGGAIKNFGMGGVMKESKKVIHDLSKPVLTGNCVGCGTCVRLCPAGALSLLDKQVQIDLDKCWGCSICQINCPHQSLTPKKAYFDDLLAQAAAACINNLPQNTFYINIIKNVTKFCDCESDPGEIISSDIGILFSDNPVAIDQASIDLVNQRNNKEVFNLKNHKDPSLQLSYASRYTKFKSDYTII